VPGSGKSFSVGPTDQRRPAASGEAKSGESAAIRAGAVAQRAAQEVRAALRPFTIPNGITLVRLALIPFFVLSAVGGRHTLALGIFIVAGVSDALVGSRQRAVRSP
jgi:hypothetical protein